MQFSEQSRNWVKKLTELSEKRLCKGLNTLYYNLHKTIDGIINDEVPSNLQKAKAYGIIFNSEESLAKEIARIANLSMKLGYKT